jgi:hypothetical protein
MFSRKFEHIFLLVSFCCVCVLPPSVAQEFKWTHFIKNKKGIVKVFAEDAVVIIAQGNDSERYTSEQLPEDWKKDGLQVTFSGRVGEIPPYIRMIGTPLKLSSISTTTEEAKKFNLKKAKIKFK